MIKHEYVYLGGERAVRADGIIGIFDMDNTTVSKHTRKFLSRAEKAGIIENLAPDIPESFALCDGAIYLSQQKPRLIKKQITEIR